MRTRRLLAGLLVAALSTLGVVAVAAPASAAVVSVGTGFELQNALDASVDLDTVVTLNAAISMAGTQVYASHTATIDLAGFDLSSGSVRLSPGITLKLVDSVGGGLLTADASGSSYDAGIHTPGANLLLAGADVVATGSATGAAIGSENLEPGAGTVAISAGDVTAISGEFAAAIGGGAGSAAGTILITGGTVHAEGGRGAGIGAGQHSTSVSGSVTITGGTVIATTRDNTGGAAIGAGHYSTIGSIAISGGTVTATTGLDSQGAAIGVGGQDPGPTTQGTSISISGGTVTATATNYGAAIGGGMSSYAGWITISGTANVHAYSAVNGAAIGSGYQGQTVSVTITGGTVVADTNSTTDVEGAAIGGGMQSGAATISISGGTVTANTDNGTTNSFGAAIGSGFASASPSITISAGTVTATGGFYGAGIGGGSNSGSGTILISGGTVDADSLQYGASIGSGLNFPSSSITISGGTVTARGSYNGAGIGGGYTGSGGTINLTGGTIEAHQVYHGAAIGGGELADGGAVTIGAGATVTAISDILSGAVSVVGPGFNGVGFGSLSVSGTLVVDSTAALSVPSGVTVTVPAGGLIKGAGSVTGAGTIANHGSIQNATVTANVTDHNYLVTFEPNLAGAVPATSTVVQVYAASFTDGGRPLPAYSETTGDWRFAGWGSTTTGPVAFDASTNLSSDRSVFGVWAPLYMSVSPYISTVGAGDTLAFGVEGLNQIFDSLGDVTASATLTSDSPDAFVGTSITFLTAGNYMITATIGGYISHAYVEVVPGPLDHLVITPDASSVIAGNNQIFAVEGYDVGGNYLGDFTSTATWSSSDATDFNTSSDFYFESPTGDRTITAELGGVSATTTITVLGADVNYLEITPVSANLIAGDTQAFTVTGYDEYDNNLGDYTSLVTVTSSVGTDAITANSVYFTQTGGRSITATFTANAGISVQASVVVDPGQVGSMNVYEVSGAVVAGGIITVGVDVQDTFGNYIDPASVVFSSDIPSDVVSGQDFAVTKSGNHRIAATLGSYVDYADVNVDPAAADYLVVSTTPAGNIVAGTSRTFAATSYDVYDNFVADETAATSFSSSDGTDTPALPSDFGFTIAGTRQISASLYADPLVVGALNVTVVGDTQHPASMTITATTTSIDQFGTVTITVSGLDQYGNVITGLEQNAVITSDVPTDVVVGNTITFPHASPHIITATLAGVSTTLLIQVIPAALAATGVEVASLLTPAALLLLLGIALVAIRRRRRA